MQISNAREVFEVIAARGRVPRLRSTVGSWEIEIDGVGTWSIAVDNGTISVGEGKNASAQAKLRFSEEEFVRLARGDNHENLVTAGLRGALLGFEGTIPFAQKLTALLPLVDEDERSRA